MIYYKPLRPNPLCSPLLLVANPADALPSAPAPVKTPRRTIDSKGLIGQKVIVLRFQASYCKPCVKESAALSKLAERYRARNVEFIAIHVEDTSPDVRAFVEAQKPAYAVALDPRLNLGNRFGFRGTPYTVLINWKGEMAAPIARRRAWCASATADSSRPCSRRSRRRLRVQHHLDRAVLLLIEDRIPARRVLERIVWVTMRAGWSFFRWTSGSSGAMCFFALQIHLERQILEECFTGWKAHRGLDVHAHRRHRSAPAAPD